MRDPGHAQPGVIEDWKQRLHYANEQLRSGEWKKGAGVADAVLGEMEQRIAGGEGTQALLAVGLLYRALGEAGAGDLQAARWDFGAAQSFYPDYARVDLTPYGAAGVTLDPWRYREPAAAGAMPTLEARDPAITPPRKKRGEVPAYPTAKRFACVRGPIVVGTTIDEEGRLGSPRLLSAVDPVLGLSALDAIRDWRFEPARRDGKPVAVGYIVTVNYKLPVCPG